MEPIHLRAQGATLAAAFTRAADQFVAHLYDPARVEPRVGVEIFCESADLDLLFADWINTLIYEIHHRGMAFARFEVEVAGIHVRGRIFGEPWDSTRHVVRRAETFGVGFTELAVVEDARGFNAEAVLDDRRHRLRLPPTAFASPGDQA